MTQTNAGVTCQCDIVGRANESLFDFVEEEWVFLEDDQSIGLLAAHAEDTTNVHHAVNAVVDPLASLSVGFERSVLVFERGVLMVEAEVTPGDGDLGCVVH